MKLLLFSLLFIASMPLAGTTHIVCEDCQLDNLSLAVNKSNSGDTIIVKKGKYTASNIIIDKPITIIGENYPQIKARNGEQIITIKSDSVTLIGLELKGVQRSFVEDRAAIYVDNANFALIKNNKIINTFFGVYLAKSKGSKVIGNKIIGNAKKEMNSANAIHLWYCQDMTISDNRVQGHRDGLYFEFCSNSVINNNISLKNLRYGLHFMFSNNNKYIKNTFEENGVGVAVMYSYGILMKSNKFISNWGPSSYGLLLKEIKDSKIQSNLFEGNTKGIYGESVIRVNIIHN
ncbi:nitrous oxide reductase family maturation protein NosD, partial [bacterium]